ncbi:hypothetical protein ACJX0J_028678, partial [Zea mays]
YNVSQLQKRALRASFSFGQDIAEGCAQNALGISLLKVLNLFLQITGDKFILFVFIFL